MEREHELEFDELFASTYPAIVRSAALVVGDREVARELAVDPETVWVLGGGTLWRIRPWRSEVGGAPR